MHFVRRLRWFAIFILIVCAGAAAVFSGTKTTGPEVQSSTSDPAPRAVLDKYCVTCHNQKLRTAGLALDTLDVTNPSANAEAWERVIGKLRAGSMPPPGNPRPDAETYRAVATWLENEIDRAWVAKPY